MAVEFRRDPNLWGGIKEVAVTHLPGLYVGARWLQRRLKEAIEDRVKFPYISNKDIGGVHFRMRITNRREQWVVDGPCFEEELLDALIKCINPGDTIFDVGAATGTHTIPADMKTGDNGIVYSFEPDAECARGLRDNLALNRIGNVVVLETALWSEDASLIFHTSGRGGVPSRVSWIGSVLTGFNRQRLIAARSIESMVRSGQVKSPDILKIDVEGAGQAVLEGLGNCRPRDIFMEVHPLLGEDKDQITGFLKRMGYGIVWERPRGSELHIHFSISTSNAAILCSMPNLFTTLG